MAEEQNINSLVNKVLKHYNLEGNLHNVTIKDKWPEIVGTMIASNTTSINLNGKNLYVKVNSAALRTELQYHKSIIVEKVNSFIGEKIINEVKIYA